eukprot:11673501-Karenia_brevis.AAC.1
MVNALALTKGRTSARGLVRPVRQAAAVILRTDVTPFLRWTPSELNPADGPSRGKALERGGGIDLEKIRSVHSALEEKEEQRIKGGVIDEFADKESKGGKSHECRSDYSQVTSIQGQS